MTSGAQFAALPLVKPVVDLRAQSSTDVPLMLLNQPIIKYEDDFKGQCSSYYGDLENTFTANGKRISLYLGKKFSLNSCFTVHYVYLQITETRSFRLESFWTVFSSPFSILKSSELQ